MSRLPLSRLPLFLTLATLLALAAPAAVRTTWRQGSEALTRTIYGGSSVSTSAAASRPQTHDWGLRALPGPPNHSISSSIDHQPRALELVSTHPCTRTAELSHQQELANKRRQLLQNGSTEGSPQKDIIRLHMSTPYNDFSKSATSACLGLQANGWKGEECCVLKSSDTNLLSHLGNCSGLVLSTSGRNIDVPRWASALPFGVKALHLQDNTEVTEDPNFSTTYWYNSFLINEMPEGWGEATGTLEVLLLDSLLRGTLPRAWSRMEKLRVLDFGHTRPGEAGVINDIRGTLPDAWSGLKDLEYLRCASEKCDGMYGTIPRSWSKLCKRKSLVLSNETLIDGVLPWEWFHQLPADWDSRSLACTPDLVIVGRGSSLGLPAEICVAKGYRELKSDKYYGVVDGRYIGLPAAIGNSRIDPTNLLDVGYSPVNLFGLSADICQGGKQDMRTILAVCTVGLVLPMCAIFYWLYRYDWGPCWGHAGEAMVAGGCHKPTRGSLVLLACKAVLALVDIGSDAYAAWQLRRVPLYLWLYIAILFAPNVLAALVVHMRLRLLAKALRRNGTLALAPSTVKLYGWFNGNVLALGSTLLLWPLWVVFLIPCMLVAAFTQCLHAGRLPPLHWLNGPKLSALLSLFVAAIEAPSSAFVFTYQYAKGMSIEFPIAITRWAFVITVGSSLLHIVMEVFGMVQAHKTTTGCRAELKSCFVDVVVIESAPPAAAAAGNDDDNAPKATV